jgi:hypothetical protein
MTFSSKMNQDTGAPVMIPPDFSQFSRFNDQEDIPF